MNLHRDGVNLSVQIRHVDGANSNSVASASNNFVRLSPQTAQLLFDIALTQFLNQSDALDQIDAEIRRSGWWIDQEERDSRKCTSGIEFLPLAITFENGETIYASYNGGDLDTSSTISVSSFDDGKCEGFICIPASFVKSFASLDETMICTRSTVYVRALPHIASASELFVEPLTTEDWDMLQLDAVSLEEGRFLQQISVVFMDQILDLWLSSGTKVSVKVLPRNFEILLDTVWPKDSVDCFSSQSCACWRLLADTKVIIQPKPRQSEVKDYPLRVVPTRQDFLLIDPSMLKLADYLKVNVVSLAQRAIMVHPNTLRRLRGGDTMDVKPFELIALVQASITAPSAHEGNNVGKPLAVSVSISVDVPEDCVAIHPLVRVGLKVPFPSNSSFVVIKHLLSPLVAAKYSRSFCDELYRGRMSLRLFPVKLKSVSSQCPPFRCPPYFEIEDRFDASIRENILSVPAESVFDPMRMTQDFPVNIGDIIFVPDDYCLYLVDATWNENANSPQAAESFVFYQRFLELTSHSLESNRDCCNREAQKVSIKDAVFPGTISRTLPADFVLPASLDGVLLPKSQFSNTFVFGDRGLGKTHLALTIAAATRVTAGRNVVYLNCRQLRDSFTIRMKAVLTELSNAFDDALKAAPCLLVLDDLDELTPSFDSYGSSDGSAQLHEVNSTEIEQSKLIADLLLDKIRDTKGRVFVLATSQMAESLPEQLLLDGNFRHRIEVPVLEDSERETIYRFFLRRLNPSAEGSWQGGFDIARKTRGFRPRDLELLAFQADKLWHSQLYRLSMKHATSIVLRSFVPLARLRSSPSTREEELNLKWRHLGGMRRAKSDLVSTIVRPSLYRRIYDRTKIRLPRGVLLYGYPGTGKSICVPALAHEFGFPLIMCRGPEILDKYIGASEAKVRALFTQAAACAPSILFFDELDSLAPRRGSDSSGVTDRIVNQLLTFLDGVDLLSTSTSVCPVYVIAATSRPDKVDPALLRPGRLEKHIFFGLTEEFDEFSDLLERISDRFSLDSSAKSSIVSGDLARAVSARNPDILRRFSAADFTAVFYTAQLMAARAALALGRTSDTASICYENLVEAMMAAQPSLSIRDHEFLSDIYNAYRLDMIPSSNLNRRVKSLSMALK